MGTYYKVFRRRDGSRYPLISITMSYLRLSQCPARVLCTLGKEGRDRDRDRDRKRAVIGIHSRL